MKIICTSINEFNEFKKNEINNFIKLNNGLIFHETKFNEIASKIFYTAFFYFLGYLNNKLVGICPVHKIRRGLLSDSYSNNGSFEIPYGGWVFDKDFIDFKGMWNKLPLSWVESLTYWSSFINDIPEEIKKKGKEFQTGLINLKSSEKELFNNVILSKRRNMVRKAEKSGITIKTNENESMATFLNLMHEMHKKGGIKEIGDKYYEEIVNAYISRGNIAVIIAYLENRPLSGVLVVGNNNVMHYWQGASDNNVPNLGQGELLQWEAIKWAKKSDAKYYDLCVIEDERLPKIAQFKMGFCEYLAPFYCLNKKSLVYRAINKFQNVFTD